MGTKSSKRKNQYVNSLLNSIEKKGGCMCDDKNIVNVPPVDDMENFVKTISHIVGSKGVGLKVQGSDSKTLLKSMKKQIPNPMEDASNHFKVGAGQEVVLKRLAKAINNEFGDVITESDFGKMCKQIEKYISKAGGALPHEITEVRKRIGTRLSNMQDVVLVIREWLKKFSEKKIEDLALSIEYKKLKTVIEHVLKLADKEIAALKKLTDAELSSNKTIDEIMKRNKVLTEHMKTLGLKPGSLDTGKRISLYLVGINDIAVQAAVADEYLKKVGLTLKDYESSDMKELKNKAIAQAKGKDFKGFSLILEALKFLSSLETHKGDVVAELKKMSSKKGGLKAPMSYDKKVKESKKIKNDVLMLFGSDMRDLFKAMWNAVYEYGESILDGVDMGAELEKFLTSLERVSSKIESKTIVKVLTGYNASVKAKESRDGYLKSLSMISVSLDSLKKSGPNNAASSAGKAGDLQKAVNDVIRKIEEYSKMMTTIQGGVPMDNAAKAHNAMLGALDSFKASKSRVETAMQVAKFKHSLGRASKELESNTEDFEQILTVAVGQKLEELKKEMKRKTDAVDANVVVPVVVLAQLIDINTGAGDLLYSIAHQQKKKNEYIKHAIGLKMSMWKVAEAIEIYLKEFNVALVNDYDKFANLEDILSPIKTLVDLGSDKTGNAIAQLFDVVPKQNGGVNVDGSGAFEDPVSAHYYSTMNPNVITAVYGKIWENVGDATTPYKMENLLKRSNESLEDYNVLKNVLSLFIAVGDRVGSTELRKKTSMTVTQIFQTMTRFMAESAFVVVGNDIRRDRLVLANKIVNFDDEHQIFRDIIKAIFAKVSAAVGVFNIFNKPGSRKFTRARVVMGGKKGGSAVETIESYVPVYIRVVLLMELYKNDIFSQEGNSLKTTELFGTEDEIISLIPEMSESVLGGLVNVIWRQSGSVKEGLYSETDVSYLIRELNHVIKTYEDTWDKKTSLSHYVVSKVIEEVNKRYGRVKKSEAELLNKEMEEKSKYPDAEVSNSILPGEDDLESAGMLAPSSAFADASSVSLDNDFYKVGNGKKLMYNFMHKADILYKKVDNESNYKSSFIKYITSIVDEHHKASDIDSKFKVIVRALRGLKGMQSSGSLHLVIFHELVVAPLQVLQHIHQKLIAYRAKFVTGPATATDAFTAVAPITSSAVLHELFEFSSDLEDLIRIERLGDKYHLEFSKLRDEVERMLENIKQVMSAMKDVVPKEITDKYELMKDSANASQPGSIYSLEEELLEKLIKGRDNEGLDKIDDVVNAHLDRLVLTDLNDYVRPAVPGVPAAAPNGLLAIVRTAMTATATEYLDSELIVAQPALTLGNNDRLFDSFNQIIGHFLEQMFEKSSGKIYNKLLRSLEAGPLSQEINDISKAYPNMAAGAPAPGAPIVDPSSGSHLLASNALIIRKLVSSYSTNGKNKLYTIGDYEDVSDSMKELYKAKLPVYHKLFKLMIKKIEQIELESELIIAATGVDPIGPVAALAARAAVAPRAPAPAPAGPPPLPVVLAATAAVPALKDYLSKLKEACFSISTDIGSVMKEVDDVPIYMQLSERSIENYKEVNGKLPFMPLSSSLKALDANVIMSPDETIGSDNFKFLYATRGLLSDQKTDINMFPGLSSLLKRHSLNISDSLVSELVGRQNMLLKSLVDTVKYKNVLVPDAAAAAADAAATAATADIVFANTVHQNSLNIRETLQLTEGDFTKAESDVAEHLGTSDTTNTRETSRLLNILDLNVNPINLHAFYRQIPFAGTYMYAYNADHLIAETLDVTMDKVYSDNDLLTIGTDIAFDQIKDANTQLARQLITQYDTLNTVVEIPNDGPKRTVYNNMAQTIMGRNGLGRPKFLSEQILNKVLFGNIYAYIDATANAAAAAAAAAAGTTPPAYNTTVPFDDAVANLTYFTNASPPVFSNIAKPATSLIMNSRARLNTPLIQHLYFLEMIQMLSKKYLNDQLKWTKESKGAKIVSSTAALNVMLHEA